MNNHNIKFEYLLKHQKYQCPLCKGKLHGSLLKLDLHHKLPKTQGNMSKFKRFVHSMMNLVVVHNHCHIAKGNTLSFNEIEASHFESFLRKHPIICKFVNGERI